MAKAVADNSRAARWFTSPLFLLLTTSNAERHAIQMMKKSASNSSPLVLIMNGLNLSGFRPFALASGESVLIGSRVL